MVRTIAMPLNPLLVALLIPFINPCLSVSSQPRFEPTALRRTRDRVLRIVRVAVGDAVSDRRRKLSIDRSGGAAVALLTFGERCVSDWSRVRVYQQSPDEARSRNWACR
jgi:hypothetical protein